MNYITFGDECWVEVSDGRHEIVYYEDLKKGCSDDIWYVDI